MIAGGIHLIPSICPNYLQHVLSHNFANLLVNNVKILILTFDCAVYDDLLSWRRRRFRIRIGRRGGGRGRITIGYHLAKEVDVPT